MSSGKPPFHSFVFNLTDRANGRVLLSMHAQNDEEYELHVEKGPAGQLTCDFTRTVPRRTAEGLRDACTAAGVFGWEEHYGDDALPGSRRWALKVVLQQDVYTHASSGGSDVPEGFDQLLEALYQLDLPRPGADDAPSISAPSSAIPNIASLFSDGLAGGPDAAMLAAMQESFAQLQAHPEQFQQQLKEEFRSLPREQQDQMIDMLASTGFASREWWNRFLRG